MLRKFRSIHYTHGRVSVKGAATLALSKRVGARLEDTEATGTIENTDLMPAALLVRFGRAAAEQVVEHVEQRMAAPRERGFRARFAGREFPAGDGAGLRARLPVAVRAADGGEPGGGNRDGCEPGGRRINGRRFDGCGPDGWAPVRPRRRRRGRRGHDRATSADGRRDRGLRSVGRRARRRAVFLH